MSSPTSQGTPTQDRPTSLSKFIRRASKVLRPKNGPTAPETSDSAPSSPMITSPTYATSVASPATTQAAPLASHPPTVPSAIEKSAEMPTAFSTTEAAVPLSVRIPRVLPRDHKMHSKQQQEKAQALFAKYGFSLESRDWSASRRQGSGETAWVEKRVCMRVHRQCHKCHTSFGSSKTCANCDHVRCTECPKWPPKKKDRVAEQPAAIEAAQEAHAVQLAIDSVPAMPRSVPSAAVETEPESMVGVVESDPENGLSGPENDALLPSQLIIDPTEQTDKLRAKHLNKVHQRRGADTVYRPPHHRARRLCHKCDTIFKGRSTDCEKCGHQRCPSCPRDPAKFSKFPEGLGYPGDVPEPEPLYPSLERVYRKPRIRVRHTCHECNSTFPSSNDRICRVCKHTRCEFCSRDPIKREAKQHSEELLRGLEGKLTGLKLLSGVDSSALAV